MSYIEKRNIAGKTYFYFTKRISFMGRNFTIKNHIGSPSLLNKEKYILYNLESLSNEELKFKSQFLTPLEEDLSHNKDLPKKIAV